MHQAIKRFSFACDAHTGHRRSMHQAIKRSSFACDAHTGQAVTNRCEWKEFIFFCSFIEHFVVHVTHVHHWSLSPSLGRIAVFSYFLMFSDTRFCTVLLNRAWWPCMSLKYRLPRESYKNQWNSIEVLRCSSEFDGIPIKKVLTSQTIVWRQQTCWCQTICWEELWWNTCWCSLTSDVFRHSLLYSAP